MQVGRRHRPACNAMSESRSLAFLLTLPALALVVGLFLYPLADSIVLAFTEPTGHLGLGNFAKAFSLYSEDILYTLGIVIAATTLTGGFALAIAGYLTLGETSWLVRGVAWLYRWPLFIPFIVAAQCMRTFLAKNGLMNNAAVAIGLLDQSQTASLLDWRGVLITFIWKQTPFVTLLLAGAMASLDRATVEAARNLGASKLRTLIEIVVPQVMPTLIVGSILSFVIMLSVLSVPMMVASSQPTMMTVDMSFRINAYGDYPVANALGVISYLMTAVVAWFYLRQSLRNSKA
jgi:putative spermidine/putrescine transport system permease protein